jgi:hypothetical protein
MQRREGTVRRPHAITWLLALVLVGAGLPALGLAAPDQQVTNVIDRYGMWVTTADPSLGPAETARRALDQLGLRWYASFDFDPDTIPAGSNKVMSVPVRPLAPEAQLRDAARKRPGSYWLIGREPNVPGNDPQSPREYAEAVQYYNRILKDADPLSKLVGPSVLNWDLTCQSCPGFDLGRRWTDQFRTAYRQLAGSEPPLDVWGIQLADLNWERLPMVNWQSLGEQLTAFRSYLDGVPALRGKPIWVTEFAIVWGYERVDWTQQTDGTWRAFPAGQYRADLLADALQGFLGWLDGNSERLGIDRWLVYGSYPPPDPFMSEYAGLRLLSTPSGNPTNAGSVVRAASNRILTAGPGGRPLFAVAGAFRDFYQRYDGARVLGGPISPQTHVNGVPVQYFEKGRLEDHSTGQSDPRWKMQYGLLVDELQQARLEIPFGGDVSPVSYSGVNRLADPSQRLPPPTGYTDGVHRMADGSVFVPFTAELTAAPGHIVPARFWDYMNNQLYFPGGWLHDIGLPITEAINLDAVKNGQGQRTVQVQAFQRTVLTYDAANPPDWQVERANVGSDFARAFPHLVPQQ